MGIRYKLNLLPVLLPEEKVLFVKKWVGFCTCLFHSGYRGSLSLPPVLEQGLYATDRRVLHVFYYFRLLKVEFDQWFDENNPAQDTELVKELRAGRHWLCGPYLEIISDNSKKRWTRSSRTRLRLYMRNAESVCRIINKAMAKSTEDS